MKKLLLPCLVLSIGLGCADGASLNSDALEVPVTAPATVDEPSPRTPTPPGPTSLPGVQIGSEGVILTDCTLRALGPDEVPTGFAATAAELTLAWTGSVDGLLDLGDGPAAGTLEVSVSDWSEVEGDGCPQRVVAGVTASIDGLPGLSAELSGNALVSPDLSSALSLWTPVWSGDLQPTLVPGDFDRFALGLDGEATDGAFALDVLFEGCDGSVCTEEPVGSFAFTP